jgi:hypothetical protein
MRKILRRQKPGRPGGVRGHRQRLTDSEISDLVRVATEATGLPQKSVEQLVKRFLQSDPDNYDPQRLYYGDRRYPPSEIHPSPHSFPLHLEHMLFKGEGMYKDIPLRGRAVANLRYLLPIDVEMAEHIKGNEAARKRSSRH